MQLSTNFLKSTIKSSIYIFCSAALLTVFNFTSADAQDSLRRSLENQTKKTGKPASVSKSKTSKTVSAQKPVSSNKPSTRSAKRPAAKTIRTNLNVTFITGEPFTDIWLNDKKIGQTGENLKLKKNLAAGEYRVMAKNKYRVIFPMTRIAITNEQTEFSLIEKPEIEKPEKDATETDTAKKSDQEIAMELRRKVGEILEFYADPKKTDSVTEEDWQIVFQAAQLGQMQDYTAVQIEAQRWFASGQIELFKLNYPNAFTAFNKAIEFMPNSALPFYALGNTHLANKQTADALKSYQRALQIDPKMAMAYKKLGDTLRILSKEKEAINAYKSAVQFGYDTVETRYGLALALLQNKQTEEAVTQLVEVAREKPNADVFLVIGDGYQKLKRDVSAIEYYQKAIQADPNSANAYFKLGDVYFSQREYVKAKEAFEKAIELDPNGKVLNKIEARKKVREAASKIK